MFSPIFLLESCLHCNPYCEVGLGLSSFPGCLFMPRAIPMSSLFHPCALKVLATALDSGSFTNGWINHFRYMYAATLSAHCPIPQSYSRSFLWGPNAICLAQLVENFQINVLGNFALAALASPLVLSLLSNAKDAFFSWLRLSGVLAHHGPDATCTIMG